MSDPGADARTERAATLLLELEEDVFEQLDREAVARRLPIDDLAAIAVIYYLADLDAGRVLLP